MKRIGILLLAIGLIMGWMGSCSSEDERGGGTMFVRLRADLPATTSVTWTNGLAFSLYSDLVEDQVAGGRGFICTDCTENMFKGKIADCGDRAEVYAIYPRQSTSGVTSIPVSIPERQEAGDGSKYEILTASAHVRGNDIRSLSFQSFCAVWKVDFVNVTDNPARVTGLRISSGEPLFATSGVMASLDVPDFTALAMQESLTSEFSSPVATDGSTSFVLLPGAMSGKRVTIEILCEDDVRYSFEETLPDGFGERGTIHATLLDMNTVQPDGGEGEEPEATYVRVTSLAELTDGEYLVVSSVANALTARYDLMSNEEQAFTYTEAYGDDLSTGKAGSRLSGAYGADLGAWTPGEDVVWEFKLEGQYDMSAGSVVTVDGWSIRNKASGLYLSLNNGQKLTLVSYVDNGTTGASLLKQRWTLEVDGELFKIRSIQNSGRYVRAYPIDGTFVLAGLTSAPTYNVYIYKKNKE